MAEALDFNESFVREVFGLSGGRCYVFPCSGSNWNDCRSQRQLVYFTLMAYKTKLALSATIAMWRHIYQWKLEKHCGVSKNCRCDFDSDFGRQCFEKACEKNAVESYGLHTAHHLTHPVNCSKQQA